MSQRFRKYLTSIAMAATMTVMVPLDFAIAADITGARIGRHPDKTRLVIDLTDPAVFTARSLSPYRIEIAIKDDVTIRPSALHRLRAAGLIQTLHETDNGLVLTLSAPGRIERAFPLTAHQAGDPAFRIVLDIIAGAPAAPLANIGPRTKPSIEDTAQPQPSSPETEPNNGPNTGSNTGPEPSLVAAYHEPISTAHSERLFEGLSLDGYAEIEGRLFTGASREPGPGNGTFSVALEPRVSYVWQDGRVLVAMTPFARLDSADSDRTHFDMREAKFLASIGRLEFRVGIDKEFWGVTESQHLVDILNQDDALEDVDGEDKLGQLMASVTYDSGFGSFTAYGLTWFRERRFAGPDGRPRGPFPVAYELTEYQSGDDKWHLDWALRWSHSLGPFDLALSYFNGTNRDPELRIGQNRRGEPVFIPRYNLIEQIGAEAQATFGPLLLKAEAIHRAQPGENINSAIFGFEYTVYNLGGQSDLGILAEYLWDSRKMPHDNPFDNDIFIALRWSANDINDTRLLVGSIFDLNSNQKFITLEGSRRISDGWRIGLEGRLFLNVPVRNPLYIYSDDDFLQLKIQKYF